MSVLVFYGIDVLAAVKLMGIEATNINTKSNSCSFRLEHLSLEMLCREVFKDMVGIKVLYHECCIIDHTACGYCEMEWGFQHETWCRTAFT
jgi:hypothetical protein